MAPTVTFWGRGELIACSHVLGISHPPGAPLYILWGRLFALLPFGSEAGRVVFALASALAVWCTYSIARMLTYRTLIPAGEGRDLVATAGGAVAALVLAFSQKPFMNKPAETRSRGELILHTNVEDIVHGD